MATFPTKEADIVELSELIYRGLLAHPEIFPAPPMPPIVVRVRKFQFISFNNQLIAARAAAAAATEAKDAALDTLIEALRSDLNYAETAVNGDDVKLKLLGWSGKSAPRPLTAPAQPRQLEAPRQGPGTITLDWKPGRAGAGKTGSGSGTICGKPAAYKVQLRRRPAAASVTTTDKWQDIATAIATEITLVNQPRGETLEYRIIALNKAGESPPSNTITAKL